MSFLNYTLQKKLGYNIKLKETFEGIQLVKTWNNIESFLTLYINKDIPYNFSFNPKNLDEEYIYRAIYLKNIPPVKHTSEYISYSEYEIHKLLYKLQKEFWIYDIHVQSVQEWFNIRKRNVLNKINQIRIRRFFFNKLTF